MGSLALTSIKVKLIFDLVIKGALKNILFYVGRKIRCSVVFFQLNSKQAGHTASSSYAREQLDEYQRNKFVQLVSILITARISVLSCIDIKTKLKRLDNFLPLPLF